MYWGILFVIGGVITVAIATFIWYQMIYSGNGKKKSEGND